MYLVVLVSRERRTIDKTGISSTLPENEVIPIDSVPRPFLRRGSKSGAQGTVPVPVVTSNIGGVGIGKDE